MTDTDKTQTALNDTLIEALFSLLETVAWDEITLAKIAAHSGISLVEMRDTIAGKIDIIQVFALRIDKIVLAEIDEDLADEPARERLFDVLMARFDQLDAYKPGIKALREQALRNPLLAAELNRIACTSQSWMLTGANIATDGLMGAARVQGAVLAFAHVMGVWVNDDDKGLAATMAELDKTLRRGEEHLERLDRLNAILEPLAQFRPPRFPTQFPFRNPFRRSADTGDRSDMGEADQSSGAA